MRISKKAIMLAGVSALALGTGTARAQLVTFSGGTITAPDATSGVAIGLLASQINNALSGSATVTGGTGVTLTPGASSAADATTTVNANTISATIAGNLAAPATGQLYTVNVAGMDAGGAGSSASTIFQLNTAPSLLGLVGVDRTGATPPAASVQTIGSTFASSLTGTAAVTGNNIGSTAVGNQTSNVVGGATPGAGVAGGSASVSVSGAVQQRTNTVGFTNLQTGTATFTASTGLAAPASYPAVVTNPSGGSFYVVSATEWYYGGTVGAVNTTAAPSVTGTYGALTDPGGSVSGTIAATTLQRNSDLGATSQIRAITDSAGVTAGLTAGATGATLDNSLNGVTATAAGNQATTGIAITGGAPSINGGLAVLSEQVNSTSGSTAAGAGIRAVNNAGSVTTTLGGAVASSSLLMEGNQLASSATGSSATNSITVDGLVRLNAATTPAAGSGTGSISTGALLSQERTTYTESVGTASTLVTSPYTTVTADSSGVGSFAAAAGTADYMAVNIQRNSGTATTPLAVTAETTGGAISLSTTAATTGVTATGSTLALSGNAITAGATGARATTTIGGATPTLLGDAASLAALSLQEGSTTSTTASVANSSVTAALSGTTAGVLSGGSLSVASNAIAASALTNVGTTSLSNIAASGGTLANATVTSGLRSDTTGDNLDASYAAPLAAISAQRVTTVGTAGTAASGATSIAAASVTNGDVLITAGVTTATNAATGSTVGLTGNRITATSGANQATVGVSFAEGMGSLLPGGAVAASSQLLAPTVSGTSVTSDISASSMQVAATSGATTASSFSGGSVTASGNRISAQAVGNQGSASMTGSSLLIAGGAGGAGASTTLTSGVVGTTTSAPVSTAQASYLVSNTQRVDPSSAGTTMAIGSTVTDGTISVLGGGTSSTVAVDNNVVSAVGAANVFDGRMTALSSSGAATTLAVSQQDVSGTAVNASLSGAGAVYSTGNSGLTSLDATTTAAAFTGGSVSVGGNTFRALSVMNEGTLVVAGAGVQDLGATGGGRTVSVTAAGGASSGLSLSGVEVGAASQQNVLLDSSTATSPAIASVGTSSVTNTRVGVNGTGTVGSASLAVLDNTVDARTMANVATVAVSGSVFAGGVAVANSQNVSQSGTTTAGLSATNTGTSVGVGGAAPPPIGTSSMAVSNNTVSASTTANDAQLQIVSLNAGSLGNATLPATPVSLSTGTGTSPFVTGLTADYMAANVQTTNGVRASSTTTGATIAATASVTGGTATLNGNRVTAETVGNRASAATLLPSLNAGSVQTASFQANNGGNFASEVVNTRIAFNASSPSLTVNSTAALSNNSILASSMGNVFNGTQSTGVGGANYVQTANRQINTGTSVSASVTNSAIAASGAGGVSSTSLGGNTVGASAMGNVMRATVGGR